MTSCGKKPHRARSPRGRRGLQEEYVSTRRMIPANNKQNQTSYYNDKTNKTTKNTRYTERQSVSPPPPSRFLSVKKIPSNPVSSGDSRKDAGVRHQQVRQQTLPPKTQARDTGRACKDVVKEKKTKKSKDSVKFSVGDWKPIEGDDDSPVPFTTIEFAPTMEALHEIPGR